MHCTYQLFVLYTYSNAIPCYVNDSHYLFILIYYTTVQLQCFCSNQILFTSLFIIHTGIHMANSQCARLRFFSLYYWILTKMKTSFNGVNLQYLYTFIIKDRTFSWIYKTPIKLQLSNNWPFDQKVKFAFGRFSLT